MQFTVKVAVRNENIKLLVPAANGKVLLLFEPLGNIVTITEAGEVNVRDCPIAIGTFAVMLAVLNTGLEPAAKSNLFEPVEVLHTMLLNVTVAIGFT